MWGGWFTVQYFKKKALVGATANVAWTSPILNLIKNSIHPYPYAGTV